MTVVRGWLGALPRRVMGRIRRHRLRGPRAIRAFARHFPNATFVQVGSNDGDKHDPLREQVRRHGWSGVMVEPVPYVFERLRRNYGSVPGIRLENVAIATEPGTLPFYYLRQAQGESGLPDWYDELGSFRRDIVLKHRYRIPDIEQRLVSADVACITFSSLCERNGISAPDLVHIDTEGYDFEIVKSIDFLRTRPTLLIYEHKHLDERQRGDCQALLRGHGYDLLEENADTWCADTRPRTPEHGAFLRDWHRIRASWVP